MSEWGPRTWTGSRPKITSTVGTMASAHLTLAIRRPQNNTAIIDLLTLEHLVDGIVSSQRDAPLILSATAIRRSAAALAFTGVSHSLARIRSK